MSLDDCLACSGCVTSAETVLITQQSTGKLLDELGSRRCDEGKLSALASACSCLGRGHPRCTVRSTLACLHPFTTPPPPFPLSPIPEQALCHRRIHLSASSCFAGGSLRANPAGDTRQARHLPARRRYPPPPGLVAGRGFLPAGSGRGVRTEVPRGRRGRWTSLGRAAAHGGGVVFQTVQLGGRARGERVPRAGTGVGG